MFVRDVLRDDVWVVLWCFVCAFCLMFLCGVCGRLCNAVWYVVLCCVMVVCLCVRYFISSWVLFVPYCVVMYGLVLCVLCLCVSVPCLKRVLFVIDCVMLYGLLSFVSCSMFACVPCVCVICS